MNLFHLFRAAILGCSNHLETNGAALAFMLLTTLMVSTQHVPLSCNRQGCVLGKNLEDGLESAGEGMGEAVGVFVSQPRMFYYPLTVQNWKMNCTRLLWK